MPQYYAARKERLKHRPARAQNDEVRAYRLCLIQDSQHALQPPAPPMSQSTKCIRFKEGHEVQEFDLGQPATSISKWVGGKAELTLTAAETKFVHEDDWNLVSPNSRHSAKVTQPTVQQIMEAIQLNRAVHAEQQQGKQPSQEANTTRQEAAIARRLAHEARQLKTALRRNEQAR